MGPMVLHVLNEALSILVPEHTNVVFSIMVVAASSLTEKKGLLYAMLYGKWIITSAISLGVALLGLGLFSLLLLLGGSNRLRDVAILVQEVENVIGEGGHDYNDLGIDLVCDRCGLER